ncbi:MAG TPA: excinuclease ABC subunit UvrC [Desulfobulbaceae bacterium]|nr:excinuclease ABC subunit UvrC [Desulfobulbaceae bacterium]
MTREHQSPANALDTTFLATVSHGPGVYLMQGKREVLYVGKAADLRKRLAQYAHFSGPAHSKTGVMLSHVRKVETILTTTEKEALILEASLIKKHRPRYNVILRDDKNYPLIKVTVKEKWPRVLVTRRRIRDGSRYFGPFASTSAMRTTLKLLFSMFPLRRCKTIRRRERPCLNYQMGRCLAPCADLVDNTEYMAMVREVILLLEGKNQHIITNLQEKMHRAAADLAFEEAALQRDRITALQRTLEHQVIAAEHGLDQDVFGLARHGASVGIALLFVRAGMISGSQNFFIADPIGNDAQILSQTLMLYYSNRRHPPRELMLPLAIEDETLVCEQLSELREGPVRLSVPRRGKRMQLMRMAAANAEQVFSKESKKLKAWQIMAKTLVHKLRLSNSPDHIECLDISNLSGKQAVGSLVCFVRGEPEKRGYRHYRITGRDEPDDYAMMREVLQRRMETGLAKNNLPDMLLLDGGKGQLGIGVEVLADFDLLDRIDLVAIAKEKQDEGEKLFRPGRKNPIILPAHAPALLYLMRIRDESHRFGITFHRRLRRNNTLRSPLDKVTGIGEQRKKDLLGTLGSYKRIQSATAKELATVPGIGPVLAESIFRQLHPEKNKTHAA